MGFTIHLCLLVHMFDTILNIFKMLKEESDAVSHTHIFNAQEAEARGWTVQGQPELQN